MSSPLSACDPFRGVLSQFFELVEYISLKSLQPKQQLLTDVFFEKICKEQDGYFHKEFDQKLKERFSGKTQPTVEELVAAEQDLVEAWGREHLKEVNLGHLYDLKNPLNPSEYLPFAPLQVFSKGDSCQIFISFDERLKLLENYRKATDLQLIGKIKTDDKKWIPYLTCLMKAIENPRSQKHLEPSRELLTARLIVFLGSTFDFRRNFFIPMKTCPVPPSPDSNLSQIITQWENEILEMEMHSSSPGSIVERRIGLSNLMENKSLSSSLSLSDLQREESLASDTVKMEQAFTRFKAEVAALQILLPQKSEQNDFHQELGLIFKFLSSVETKLIALNRAASIERRFQPSLPLPSFHSSNRPRTRSSSG